jgi:endonuclease YncB( thermonuclease family)
MCNTCKSKTLITEEERLSILRKYNLIEQKSTTPSGGAPKGFTVDDNGRYTSPFITNLYAPGFYTLEDHEWKGKSYSNKGKLNPYIQAAKEFLKTNKGLIPRIYVSAGESIIPNYDNEGKLGGGKLKEGALSKARSNNIQAYFLKEIQSLIDGKFVSRKPDEIRLDTITGKTQKKEPSGGWDSYRTWVKAGADPNSNPEYAQLKQGYDNDQFTQIRFVIEPDLGENQCLFNLKLNINFDSGSHNCNAALFEVTANGTKITTQQGTDCNMNNGGYDKKLDPIGYANRDKLGGYRYNTLVLKDKATIEKILAASPKKEISIRLRCLTPPGEDRGWGPGKCHTSVPHVSVKNSDGQVVVEPFFPNVAEGEICVLDKCGNLLRGGGGSVSASGDKTTTIAVDVPTSYSGTSQQYADSFVKSKIIKLNPDNKSYNVLVDFKSGKTATQPIKKGSNITFNQKAATPATTTTTKVAVPTGTTPIIVKVINGDTVAVAGKKFVDNKIAVLTTTPDVYKIIKTGGYNTKTYTVGQFIKLVP